MLVYRLTGDGLQMVCLMVLSLIDVSGVDFYVTEQNGEKVTDPDKIEQMRKVCCCRCPMNLYTLNCRYYVLNLEV